MHRFGTSRARLIGAIALLAVAGLGAATWVLLPARVPSSAPESAAASPLPEGPPWRYGRDGARYTVTAYADLECPHCRTYFPRLRHWIDANPEVVWQWHHLPLPMHEPAATQGARLAECAGLTDGPAAFWHAVHWHYDNTRGNGRGLPDDARYPGLTPAVQQCLDSDRPDAAIRTQADQAAHEGISGTPTLHLHDRRTDRTLLLHGPVEDDALLSAIDLVSAPIHAPPASDPMSADDVGDMPR